MNEPDIEVEAYGLQASPFALTLYLRAPDGEFHMVIMPRVLGEALARDIVRELATQASGSE